MKSEPQRRSGESSRAVAARDAPGAVVSRRKPGNTTLPVSSSPRLVAQRRAINAAFGVLSPFSGSASDVDHGPGRTFAATAQARSKAVVQGRFVGDLGARFLGLTPASLGVGHTYYATLWNALRILDRDVRIEAGEVMMAHYDPEATALRFRMQMFRELEDHATGAMPMAADVRADHVSLVTHEMSHAHDHLVRNRELRQEGGSSNAQGIQNVFMTEILAWEREARTNQRLRAAHAPESPLWRGWIDLEGDMLVDFDSLRQHRDTNAVVARLWSYFRREWLKEHGDFNRQEVDAWFGLHWGPVRAEALRLAAELLGARDTI